MSLNTSFKWNHTNLNLLFNSLNNKYWSSSLQDWNVSTEDCIGLYGQCDSETLTIRIRLETHRNDQELQATLVHEMAHAVVGLDHDAQWRAEMERVRALGAPTDAMDFLVPYDEMRSIAASFVDAARSGETDFDFVCKFLDSLLLSPCCENPGNEQAGRNLEVFRNVFDAERESMIRGASLNL